VAVHLFGLTGGIASGKSTVGARLRTHHVPVIDADELAREVVAPGTDGLREVVEAFGEDVLGPRGALDRKALARLVFADAALRQKLNAITHPRIAARTLERAAELARVGEPLACYEAALIVENGLADAFRPLVVCACPEDVQVARLRARDGATPKEALVRIRAQKPLAEKIAIADHVIDTSGSLEDTGRQTDEVLRAIGTAAGVDSARYFASGAPPRDRPPRRTQ
jgi:dephospho-CoA kinase